MADRIKGITIEIGGDTTQLSKALSGINKEISSTQSQLKDLERLLKLDPQNVVLMEQKQRALTKAIADTESKLRSLQEAEKQVQAQFERGEVSQKQYDALQREIEATEIKLGDLKEAEKQVQAQLSKQKSTNSYKSLQNEIKQTETELKQLKQAQKDAQKAFENGEISERAFKDLQSEIDKTEQKLKSLQNQADKTMAEFGNKVKSVGQGISSVGSALLPLSAASAGALGAGLKVATDFEAEMSNVKAITQANEQQFEQLRQVAIQLGADTKFSSSEVANAMAEMAKAGWDSQQIIDGMGGVLDAAAASGEELGTVSTIVADAITGFGLAASDSTRVADLLTEAANGGTISIADLGETMKYVAPLGQSVGLSIEDATTAIEAMSMAGIKGSQAGTSLRGFMLNLIKPSSTVAAAMDKLGLSITDSSGNFKSLDQILREMRAALQGLSPEMQQNTVAAITGKEAYSGIQAVLNMTQQEYDALSESMRNSTGVADQTAAVMQDNLQAKVEQLGGALESLAIVLADNIIPWLTSVIEKVTEWVQGFSQMDEGTQKLVLGLMGITAIASPVLSAIGSITQGIGSIITVAPKISQAFSAVSTAMTTNVLPKITSGFNALSSFLMANPLAAGIAVCVGAIAIFGDDIQAALGELDSWLQGVFATDMTEFFGPTLGGIMNQSLENLKTIWDGVKQVFDGIIDFIRGVFTGDWERAWNGIVEIFEGVFGALEGIAKGPINGIISLLNLLIDAINWAIDGINSISFDVPDWVPGIGGQTYGFNIPNIPNIPYLAKGGILSRGSAVVGEAGPELLTLSGGRAIVQPLTGGNASPQITQTNYFNGYQPRDGARAVRDLNRQLGWEY